MLNFTPLTIHETYMQRCLDLAKLANGNTAPNPMVGAVLVYQNKIIGEGYHQQYGMPHAEVNCINSVRESDRSLIKESTLYISLEPCNHHGKTPPCTDLIIANEIPRVVIACKDSFEKVNGTGIKKLTDNNIEVISGVLEKEALELNKYFFHFHKNKRPYIILKWAQSGNGMIAAAGGKPVKISNELTDKLVHRWRSETAAIIVGTNTVEKDNPSLTTRLWAGKNPIRIFIDKQLKAKSTSNILDNSVSTLIFNFLENKTEGLNEYIKIDSNQSFIQQLNSILFQKNILSLIVEGGSKLLQSFIDEGSWDEARVITNKQMNIENGIESPIIKNELSIKKESIGNDEVEYYLPNTSTKNR